jgi:hypothetical protein
VIKNVQRKRHLVARAGFNRVINANCKIWWINNNGIRCCGFMGYFPVSPKRRLLACKNQFDKIYINRVQQYL